MDALTVAHELGHNLGMDHTFETNCSEPDGYIMSYKNHDPNNWQFTPCSVKSLKEHIKKSPCIQTSGGSMALQTDKLPGQHFNVDAQCALGLDGGYLVKDIYTEATYRAVCYRMLCCSRTSGCTHTQALEYTDCGSGRWCIQGQCVPKSK